MKKIINNNKQSLYLFIFISIIFFLILQVVLPLIFGSKYLRPNTASLVLATTTPKIEEEVFTPSYVETPKEVRGIYMTSWVAGVPSLRENLVKIIDDTEINSIVIDIKDYSGKIVYEVSDPNLKNFGSEEIRVKDLRDFIERLHKKNIYVIGRVAVFQDAYFVKKRPDLAVKTKDGSGVWKDRKGISWIDAGSRDYWDYIISIAKESRKIGFDEINFDYIRFPSDGNMQDISFPQGSTTPKAIVLRNFFEYLHDNLKDSGLKISADLFGMTTSAKDDMGIGQIIENALPYFDYVMPMVYPSHYPPSFEGYADPEAHPYEIIKYAMQSAVDRSELLASTTQGHTAELRPWLQDFGLHITYGPTEVKAQIQATYDVGLNSWILWSPSNRYTTGALKP